MKTTDHKMIQPNGLSASEVAEQRRLGNTNDSEIQTSRSLAAIIRANVLTRFNALLGVLCVIVLFVGSPIDALFGAIIIINSAIGVFQELRAKRTLDALAILQAPQSTVIRDAKATTIAIADIVLGDVLLLRSGDQVPADGQVLAASGLETDESLLTGEADPVAKLAKDTVLSGAIVVAGTGYIKTTAVGSNAYAYKIAEQAKQFTRVRSELVDGTNALLGYISIVIVIVAPLLLYAQIVNSGLSWQEAIVRSSAAIVGMIPEGLVLLTSLAFMLAVLSLAKQNVLVQRLPAVESLARVDVVCLDKTGTLTEGTIGFEGLHMLDKHDPELARAVLASFAADPASPTLSALHTAFPKQTLSITDAVAFSSARKWSAISVNAKQKHWVMGAPEILSTKVSASNATALRAQATKLAAAGKRVLLLAVASEAPTVKGLPKELLPFALLEFGEKIRDDAAETLRYFHDQGVDLKVISGDNPVTVGAVAAAVGIANIKTYDARKLPEATDQLGAVLDEYNVFGRVTPEQKRQMVKALQANGHVVAMTGDGVNDALALKDADVGIAMRSGAAATRAVAELVLLDNSFAHMPHVVAEGRRVIANIERVANLFLIKNVYSLALALAVTVATLPYPFLPRHMTILSSLTIGIPAFFLALAPNLQRYHPGFLKRVLRFAVPAGITIALLIFASYLWVRQSNGSAALASTVAALTVMGVGTWTLLCLARPLAAWKVALVLAMPTLFAAGLAIPFLRTFLDLTITMQWAINAAGLIAAGAVLVELQWRWASRQFAGRTQRQ